MAFFFHFHVGRSQLLVGAQDKPHRGNLVRNCVALPGIRIKFRSLRKKQECAVGMFRRNPVWCQQLSDLGQKQAVLLLAILS